MTTPRVAIIFNDTLRPETTGTYCFSALKGMAEVRHFHPDELDRIPRTGFDLYLNIDDGLRYHLPPDLRPCAWWVIDTHLDPDWALARGPEFDWIFAAQRDGAALLSRAGLPAVWLPLACDPAVHRPWELPNAWDVCFVGRIAAGPRSDLLAEIRRHFPRSFIGQCYFDQYAQTCSASRVGFNRSVRNDVNMRVFETLGCGILLLTNDLAANGQNELLLPDTHLVTYHDRDELLDKLRFYTKADGPRQRIAAAGHAHATANHTYAHRMRSILDTVARGRSSSVPSVPQSSEQDPASEPADTDWRDSVDFCIPGPFRPEALLRLLRSILEHQPDVAVTVADEGDLRCDGSDGKACAELIDRTPGWARIPVCPGQARHALVRDTRRPLLLWINADCEITATTHPDRLVERLGREPAVGVIAGAYPASAEPWCSGATMTLANGVLEIDTRRWRNEAAGVREYVPPLMLIRREVFDTLDWDGGTETCQLDLCLQLLRSGWGVRQEMSVVAAHDATISSLPDPPKGRSGPLRPLEVLLRKWGLAEIVRDGEIIARREAGTRAGRLPPGRQAPRGDWYYGFPRPEVAALVPQSARRILDIGCGAGRLGESLRQRQDAEVTGLELDGEAAAEARGRLDRVCQADVADPAVGFPSGSFDCIICADVLEHVRRPEVVLARARHWLTPGGCLVASIPNARHHSVVAGLLDGNWTYEQAGLLDQDHVRFFTRREVEKLFYRAGFAIERLIPKPGPGHARWKAEGRPGRVEVGALRVGGLAPEVAEEFFTYQYLVVARPFPDQVSVAEHGDPKRESGLTSVVIVTHNQLAFTRECVDSVVCRTDEPYEFIFVDNGSTDGTPEYLASVRGAAVILNPDNRGFPTAVNQGLQRCSGEFILLLNNDTVVSTGWLRRMLAAMRSDPQIGLVGPCSNRVSGSQQVDAGYSDLACMDGFAWDWGRQYDSQREDTDRLVGFCLLARHSLFDQIGALDERFGIGCYEDDDLCLRAIHAGWRAVIARDAFVHHYGGRTFLGSGADYAGVMAENRRRFEQKWSPKSLPSPPPVAEVLPALSPGNPPFGVRRSPGGGLLLEKAAPLLSLCMIVRDNAGTIGACLESIAPWVDEMIVVDTGSKDATPAIAARCGARVFHSVWPDSFSAARNESLRHARGEWIFWMDSDDTISSENGRELRRLAGSGGDPRVLGYVMQVHCPGPGPSGGLHKTVVDHVKLFRNRPDLRFTGRIHEQILPAIRKVGGEVAWTDLYVVHTGYDHSPEGQEGKKRRDLHLLALELAEQPGHPFTLFNLGMTHGDVGDHAQAVSFLRESIRNAGPTDSHLPKAYARLVYSLNRLGDPISAEETCLTALARYPDDLELRFRRALLLQEAGRLAEAVIAYRDVLARPGERHFRSVDPGIGGYKARQNLALVLAEAGDWQTAAAQWREVVTEVPGYAPGCAGLGEALLRCGLANEAGSLLGRMENTPGLEADTRLLRARLAEGKGRGDTAREEMLAALVLAPDDLDLRRIVCRSLFEWGEWPAARDALETLVRDDPADGGALLNLGMVLLQLGDPAQAVTAFRRSLIVRPGHAGACRHLARTLESLGASVEAAGVWRDLLKSSPDDAEALRRLRTS